MMSFARSTAAMRSMFAASRVQSRAITTTPRLASNGSTQHGNDPDVLEKGKQSSLDKQKKGSKEQARWHEELASESEAFVKADREEIDLDIEDEGTSSKTSKEEIEKLKKKTTSKREMGGV